MTQQVTLDPPLAARPAAATTSVLAIGLMSGTSQDGVDVVLIDTDGETIAQFGATACRPYTKAERTLLRRATAAAANLTDCMARPDILAEAELLVNDAHAEAVEAFIGTNGLKPANLTAVGFPGQTLLHRPERNLTLQIGNGPALAARLGVPVVYDFRTADVAAGGQGAPLSRRRPSAISPCAACADCRSPSRQRPAYRGRLSAVCWQSRKKRPTASWHESKKSAPDCLRGGCQSD